MHGRQEAWKGAQLLLRLTENAHTMGCPFGPEEKCAGGQLPEALEAVSAKQLLKVWALLIAHI